MVCFWIWAIMKLNTIQQGICLTISYLDGTLIWSLTHIWALRIHRSSKKGKENYAQKLRRRLQFGYKLAREKNTGILKDVSKIMIPRLGLKMF